MAYLTKRRLTDEKSNKFLESNGFTNVSDCLSNYSTWATYDVRISFPLNAEIRNIQDLANVCYGQGVEDGRLAGRESYRDEVKYALESMLP